MLSAIVLTGILSLHAAEKYKQTPLKKSFNEFVDVLQDRLTSQKTVAVAPRPDELKDWDRALDLIRKDSIANASALLAAYNYSVTTMTDLEGGNSYLVVSENEPLQHNWGTFVYNKHAKKRLVVHVERPSKEGNTLPIGSELFRRLGAEWLCIAGPEDLPGERSVWGQMRSRPSIFARWHEILVDLTHVTLSVHGYRSVAGTQPDIVLSNGRTSDEQWGISQISLGVRDSLRQAGFGCALAMFDSGFASLAGAKNRAGIFANDSVGFGHWLSFELSAGVRYNNRMITKFVAAVDRALDVTGKRISQQVNRAFGLVSPRVVRVDSLHRIMFPPSGGESYRIVSFNAASDRTDTLDVRMGQWLDMNSGGSTVSSVSPFDPGTSQGTESHRASRRTTRTAIVQSPSPSLPTVVKYAALRSTDTSASGDRLEEITEPVGVHRIPLDKVPVAEYAPQIGRGSAAFSLPGILPASDRMPIPVFAMGGASGAGTDESALSFLVPLINPTTTSSGTDYIGVRMNNVLVSEIARLIAKHADAGREIGLVAEQAPDGTYYLRIIAGARMRGIASADLARKF